MKHNNATCVVSQFSLAGWFSSSYFYDLIMFFCFCVFAARCGFSIIYICIGKHCNLLVGLAKFLGDLKCLFLTNKKKGEVFGIT